MDRSLLHRLDPKDFGPLLARLLAIADDAVIVADAQQRIVLFNDGAERVFGHRVADVLGQPLALLLPEGARAAHEQHMRAFAQSSLPARRMAERRDIHGRRADGSLFDAEASISHLELDGQIFFAAILRDVSEARRDTRALVRSEERFRELAASAPVGIFQTDASGACVYVNARWVVMAGMEPDQAAGHGWLRAIHPADRAHVERAWNAAVEGRAGFDLRYRFARPDGNEVWVMARAVASRDAAGAVSGFLGTVTDVTESHHQAQALEQARAEAESAVRAKSLFLANISHEIRTPLNAVIGMTTLLLDTPMSDDQRELARTICGSGEALLAIINDILDYSKADIGKLEIEQQAFDLRRCIEDALDQVAPRALEKRLNLAYLIEDGTPETLLGDVTRIRQILANLLSNAVKFTHQGEVFVGIDSEALDGGAHRIHFAVHDSGIGIAAEHLPRLFQSFTQVDASTTRKYGGTGLGLAISKRLAELMGGSVSVDSEAGRGSVFRASVVVHASPTEPPAFLQRHVPALVGKRLLIVDDKLTNRRILTRLAMRWGMEPASLASAVEALDRVRHGERFDIAVLDMNMPGVDGLVLVAELRDSHGDDELPVVLLTSLGQRQALPSPGSSGLASCLARPIKASQLFTTLLALAEGRPLAVSAPMPLQPASRGPLAPTLPLRVLVAEDNLVNQRVALRLLRRLGVDADVAANGLEVIDAVERQPYDIVLMDIQMPEMDGLQAARWIVQRRAPGAGPRIIAMTANAMPGDRDEHVAAGMDGFVAKPIEVNDLAAALTAAAGHLRHGATAGRAATAAGVSVDAARLEHLRSMQADDQPGLVRELIDMYVVDSPGHLGALSQALVAEDAPLLGRLAHRFLSVTQNIGARRMSDLCAELERLSRQGLLDEAAPLVGALGQEHERVQAALLAARARY